MRMAEVDSRRAGVTREKCEGRLRTRSGRRSHHEPCVPSDGPGFREPALRRRNANSGLNVSGTVSAGLRASLNRHERCMHANAQIAPLIRAFPRALGGTERVVSGSPRSWWPGHDVTCSPARFDHGESRAHVAAGLRFARLLDPIASTC